MNRRRGSLRPRSLFGAVTSDDDSADMSGIDSNDSISTASSSSSSSDSGDHKKRHRHRARRRKTRRRHRAKTTFDKYDLSNPRARRHLVKFPKWRQSAMLHIAEYELADTAAVAGIWRAIGEAGRDIIREYCGISRADEIHDHCTEFDDDGAPTGHEMTAAEVTAARDAGGIVRKEGCQTASGV